MSSPPPVLPAAPEPKKLPQRLWAQPYPFHLYPRRVLRSALLFGTFVLLFLLVFQPFGLGQLTTGRKLPIMLGYGGITAAIMLGLGLLCPWLAPRFFSESRWTVAREMMYSCLNLLLIGLGNLLFSAWLGITSLHPASFLLFLGYTLAIGIFPITGTVLLTYFHRLQAHTRQATEVNTALAAPHAPAPDDPLLELVAENGKDRLQLRLSALLYLSAADNYVTVWFRQEEKVQREVLRSSLSRLEEQLPHPALQRCHRSYLVNLRQVTEVSGNAQGYRLVLPGTAETVPVSRSASKQVLEALRHLNPAAVA